MEIRDKVMDLSQHLLWVKSHYLFGNEKSNSDDCGDVDLALADAAAVGAIVLDIRCHRQLKEYHHR